MILVKKSELQSILGYWENEIDGNLYTLETRYLLKAYIPQNIAYAQVKKNGDFQVGLVIARDGLYGITIENANDILSRFGFELEVV